MGARTGPIEVLCVDDDDALLSLLSEMLERQGPDLETTTLSDPEAVLSHLEERSFDCVVCDYEMPARTGLAVLEDIRERHPDLPFILYTGKGSEEIASEAITAGVTDYMQKDSGGEHYELLANRIREYVGHYRTGLEYELTEQRYRRLVEQSVVGIGLSQDGIFRYANPKFADIFGYSAEELVGAPVETVIAESDHQRVREALRRREAGDVDSVHYVLTGEDKSGDNFEVEVNGSRVSYDGAPAVLGVVQPLDTRRKAVAEADPSVVADLRISLERAMGLLSQADPDVEAARDTLAESLASLTQGGPSAAGAVDATDVGACCEAAFDVDGVSLTIETTTGVVGGRAAIQGLFEALQSAWSVTDTDLSVTLSGDGDVLELVVKPADADVTVSPPADPPAVSRTADLLGWDVHVTESDGGGVRYEFQGVDRD